MNTTPAIGAFVTAPDGTRCRVLDVLHHSAHGPMLLLDNAPHAPIPAWLTECRPARQLEPGGRIQVTLPEDFTARVATGTLKASASAQTEADFSWYVQFDTPQMQTLTPDLPQAPVERLIRPESAMQRLYDWTVLQVTPDGRLVDCVIEAPSTAAAVAGIDATAGELLAILGIELNGADRPVATMGWYSRKPLQR